MRRHDQFEIMCALAASGQLSEPELRELKEHAGQCIECNDRIVDFVSVSAQVLLPQLARRGPCRIPKGMEDRFAARALAEGIPLRRSAHAKKGAVSLHAIHAMGALSAALLLALLIVGPFAKPTGPPSPNPIPQASVYQETSPLPAGAVSSPSTIQQQAMKLIAKAGVRAKSWKQPLGRREKRPTWQTTEAGSSEAASFLAALAPDAHFAVQSSPALLRALPNHEFAPTNPLDLFSTAAFEIRSSARPHHVFRYDPHGDQAPKQVSFLPPNVDWYRLWVQQGPISSSALYTSAR